MKDIYILCPSNISTGGPELLHQLCHKLNKIGIGAKMLYTEAINGNFVHPNYEFYNNKYVTEIQDNDNNLIIIPEIFFGIITQIPLSKKIIWWLSVDNFANRLVFEETPNGPYCEAINYLYSNNELEHFVQSEYANNFLSTFKIDKDRIYYLSDYLNKAFIEEGKKSNTVRENNVLYNPSKGFDFTKKLIERAPHINWIPLVNYTPTDMAKLMQNSKVYIDFGAHPGKDRIPREAAISGCCIITNLKGSAKFHNDIPIPCEYKIEDTDANIDLIIEKIEYLLQNYNSETTKFDYYREIISNEENKFEEAISSIFTKLLSS